MNKKELRTQIKAIKQSYSFEQLMEKSDLLFKQVEKEPMFQQSKIIMIYWAMADEVQTKAFILKWADNKQFILPSVNGEVLDLKIFEKMESMKAGESFGILEPMGENFTNIDAIQLIIVPGIAFDKSNNRMGRGKGYYDKLLKQTNAFKLGVCFDFQLFDTVPTDELDVAMDKILYA